MKSQIAFYIVIAVLMVNCKGTYQTVNKPGTDDSVTPVIDLRPIDLMAIVSLYEQSESNWPTSYGELRTVDSFDSVDYYLKDFSNIKFLTLADTLHTTFQLKCSSTKFGLGNIKLNKQNDSTYFEVNMEQVCGSGIKIANGSFCINCSNNYNNWNHLGELVRFIAFNNE